MTPRFPLVRFARGLGRIGVPFAKSLDPVTKTNWEGTGVEPDVKVKADDALSTAERLAAQTIDKQKEKPPAPAKAM